MKKSVLSLILIFTVVIAASAVSYSQPEEKHENFRGKMFEKLNLTDDQKAKVEDLMIAHQKAMVDLRADLQKKRLDMKDLIHKGNFSRSDFLSAVKAVNDSRDKIAEAKANHMMDVYQLLTDQQKKMFSEMPMMMQGKMRDCCKMMDGKGPMKMPGMK